MESSHQWNQTGSMLLNMFITVGTKEVISEEKSLLILLTLFRVLKVGTVSKKDLMRLKGA